MALHLFDDVLLLDFSLEAAKGVFQGLALLKLYFSQPKYTSQLDQKLPCKGLQTILRLHLKKKGPTPKKSCASHSKVLIS